MQLYRQRDYVDKHVHAKYNNKHRGQMCMSHVYRDLAWNQAEGWTSLGVGVGGGGGGGGGGGAAAFAVLLVWLSVLLLLLRSISIISTIVSMLIISSTSIVIITNIMLVGGGAFEGAPDGAAWPREFIWGCDYNFTNYSCRRTLDVF